MNNQTLLKISFIVSILGILILLFISENIEPVQVKIKDITDLRLNQKVRITGQIIGIKTYQKSSFQIITINDSMAKIDVTLDKPLNLTKNQTIIVTGKITEYKTNLQIQADKIQILSLTN
jgi:aspartyl/asparaginyl-tRNA synthetase